jgi:hypothetical protein
MRKFLRLFLKHPNSAGETYCQHFRYAGKLSCTFIVLGLMCVTHAFFPFIFTHDISAKVKKISEDLQERKHGHVQ